MSEKTEPFEAFCQYLVKCTSSKCSLSMFGKCWDYSWYYDFSLQHQTYFPIFITNSLNILYAFSNIPIKMASVRTGSESGMTHIHSVSACKAGQTHTSHACEWLWGRSLRCNRPQCWWIVLYRLRHFPGDKTICSGLFSTTPVCLSVCLSLRLSATLLKIAKYTTLRTRQWTRHLFQCRYAFQLANIQMLHLQVRMDDALHF